jgi:hypothetical protein
MKWRIAIMSQLNDSSSARQGAQQNRTKQREKNETKEKTLLRKNMCGNGNGNIKISEQSRTRPSRTELGLSKLIAAACYLLLLAVSVSEETQSKVQKSMYINNKARSIRPLGDIRTIIHSFFCNCNTKNN